MTDFSQFPLDSRIIEAVEKEGYDKATPIQKEGIPAIVSGNDFFGRAQTGSGKTATFALPILEHCLKDMDTQDTVQYNRVKALVLAPTRELAIQIEERFRIYGQLVPVSSGVIYGGVTPKRHIKVLKREPSIIVATPGRLLELIRDGYLDTSSIDILVLDEADRMLELGMLEDVKEIIKALPQKRQNLMFSATLPKEIQGLVSKMLNNPIHVDIKDDKKNTPKIEQRVLFMEETHKAEALLDLLHYNDYQSVIVFVRTKRKADKLAKQLNVNHIRTKAFHGDVNQSQRMAVLELFKQKEVRVLIATDVAARGIDIDQLEVVINFNIPSVPETYIHRIGRTGRAGKKGLAISYCSKQEEGFLKAIEQLQNKKIKRYDR